MNLKIIAFDEKLKSLETGNYLETCMQLSLDGTATYVNISPRFPNDSGSNASEILENAYEMFPA